MKHIAEIGITAGNTAVHFAQENTDELWLNTADTTNIDSAGYTAGKMLGSVGLLHA